jgi:hypothetical protein
MEPGKYKIKAANDAQLTHDTLTFWITGAVATTATGAAVASITTTATGGAAGAMVASITTTAIGGAAGAVVASITVSAYTSKKMSY